MHWLDITVSLADTMDTMLQVHYNGTLTCIKTIRALADSIILIRLVGSLFGFEYGRLLGKKLLTISLESISQLAKK